MKNQFNLKHWILLLTLNKASLSHHSGYYEYTLLGAVASILFSRVLILHVRIVKISILIGVNLRTFLALRRNDI